MLACRTAAVMKELRRTVKVIGPAINPADKYFRFDLRNAQVYLSVGLIADAQAASHRLPRDMQHCSGT
jgi:hypothetical protein